MNPEAAAKLKKYKSCYFHKVKLGKYEFSKFPYCLKTLLCKKVKLCTLYSTFSRLTRNLSQEHNAFTP